MARELAWLGWQTGEVIPLSTSSKIFLEEKAARCGEPSYVWRAGQERRLQMILTAAEDRVYGAILENGCGVGMYVEHLSVMGGMVVGLEFDLSRAGIARQHGDLIVNAAAEWLPFPDDHFDLILSHEVLEHVANDREAVEEMVRVLRPGGRMVVFVPNRGYPFETHGIYWKGRYRFGNIPFVNYLPRPWRNRLAPHVRIYNGKDLQRIFAGLPVRLIDKNIIFGAYDNVIARWPRAGRLLRAGLHWLEQTPLNRLGLSHMWVVEKT